MGSKCKGIEQLCVVIYAAYLFGVFDVHMNTYVCVCYTRVCVTMCVRTVPGAAQPTLVAQSNTQDPL